MTEWLKHLDAILRGYKTDTLLLVQKDDHAQPRRLLIISIILGASYGLFMGAFAVFTRKPPCYAQMFLTGAKVPALFFLTLIVTLPSLYVFSALEGIKLGFKETLRLIMIPITVNLTVLASLGPITGFFTLCTTSYPFIKLLNVFFFALSGIIGLKVLLTMMERIDQSQLTESPVPPPPTAALNTDATEDDNTSLIPKPKLNRPRSQTNKTFKAWLVIYALVGAQMGWILRPFIGSPDIPFAIFRNREANIFIDVVRTVGQLLGL